MILSRMLAPRTGYSDRIYAVEAKYRFIIEAMSSSGRKRDAGSMVKRERIKQRGFALAGSPEGRGHMRGGGRWSW